MDKTKWLIVVLFIIGTSSLIWSTVLFTTTIPNLQNEIDTISAQMDVMSDNGVSYINMKTRVIMEDGFAELAESMGYSSFSKEYSDLSNAHKQVALALLYSSTTYKSPINNPEFNELLTNKEISETEDRLITNSIYGETFITAQKFIIEKNNKVILASRLQILGLILIGLSGLIERLSKRDN